MSSYDYGKPEICAWVRKHFPRSSTILDVGACDGKWRRLLPEYPNMDAVEAFEPNLQNLQGYRDVFHADICDFSYAWYDLVILGDIVEHLSVEAAQNELEYARDRCRDMIVAVPFLYKQDAIYGNPYEVHIQDDLTPENFAERYPGFEVLLRARDNYCYYHKAAE